MTELQRPDPHDLPSTPDDVLPSPSDSLASPSDSLASPGDGLASPAADRLLVAVTAIAVVAGVIVRFLPRSGLWLDEALSANIAGLPLGDIPSALRKDGHPPLFYALLHLWSSIGGESDWWIRAMSGVISTLTLPLMYLAGERVAGRAGAGPLGRRRTGLIALAVAAVMPFGIRYAAEARMYALVTALAVLGYLLVDDLLTARSAGRRRVGIAVATALVAAALLWTHYWSMWLLAAVGLLALWQAWRAKDPQRRSGARLLIAALVVGGILFLPWVSALLYQSSHTGTPWGDQYGPASVVVLTIVDFAGAKFGVAHLFTYLLVPLILLAAFASIQRAARADLPGAARVDGPDESDESDEPDEPEAQQVVLTTSIVPRVRVELAVLVLTLAIGWAAAFVSSNTFSSRYTSGVYPLFLLCIAAGVAVLRRPRVTAVVLAVIVVAGTWGAIGAARADRSQNGELADRIVQDAAGSASPSVVISCPDQLGVSLQREIEHRRGADSTVSDVIPYPAAGDPHFIDWADYGERNESASPEAFFAQIAARIPADATVYLVTSDTYKTFEGQCEGLIALLSQNHAATLLEPMSETATDEYADLWVFRPAT